MGMIEGGQNYPGPNTNLKKFPSFKHFQKSLNDITQKIRTFPLSRYMILVPNFYSFLAFFRVKGRSRVLRVSIVVSTISDFIP